MRLYSPSKQLRLTHCVLILVSVFLVYPALFFVVDPLGWQAGAAEIQKNKASSDSDEADFSQSVMLGPDQKIREGDTIDCEIILRNTGSKGPESIELWNPVDSTSAMLASAPEMSYDLENRVLKWHGTVDPGEERRLTVRLVTLPESAGTIVSNRASIVWDSKKKGFSVRDRSAIKGEGRQDSVHGRQNGIWMVRIHDSRLSPVCTPFPDRYPPVDPVARNAAA